jgi:hypothetical protein
VDAKTRDILEKLRSDDANVRYDAFCAVLTITESPVDWAYEVWDEYFRNLSHKSNHVRAQATQLLCNLAKSDPENRILKDFDAIMAVTRDEKFVTARHTLQAVWKVGVVGKAHRKMVVDRLASRFKDCVTEKNCTLIRYDIIADLRQLYDAVHDEAIKTTALELIKTEEDTKYRKKYATLWRR